jgi:hypothetical protein
MTFTTFEAQYHTPPLQKKSEEKREILTSSSEMTQRFPECKSKQTTDGELSSCYRVLSTL